MQDRLRSYTIVSLVCLACAAGITVCVWLRVPVEGNVWLPSLWFVLFAALGSLLAVGFDENNRTLITLNSAAYWTSTCVLGPAVSILVGAVSSVLGHVITCGAFYAARSRGLLDAQGMLAAPKPRGMRFRNDVPARDRIWYTVARIGANWYMRDLDSVLRVVALQVGTVALSVGLSGLVYQWLGGRFLVSPSQNENIVRELLVPFVALVATSIVVENAVFVIVMAAIDPVPGSRRVYAILLRLKMAIIEVVLPVWKGELFLSVVALMLSYLYAYIGTWGFVLAVMPILTLRDFFNQWVEEKAAYMDTITTLATYMQHYHPYTRGHLKRVADLSERLARELRLPAESVLHMRTAGFLHDIGKIGVSEEILDKTEKLSDDEWGQIKEHPVKGAEIISHLEFLEGIIDWVKYHHKWHNGAGYPTNGSDGSEIPIEAAIISVADAFDAMTDDRELSLQWKCDSCGYVPPDGGRPNVCPECGAEKRRIYREPKSLDQAIDELRRGAGTQFHPSVVKAFLSMIARDGVKADAA